LKGSGATIALSMLAAMSLSSSATADNMDCSLAVSSYDSANALVGAYLKDYSACIASSYAKVDCGREFRRLEVAQSRYEPAVIKVQADCRNLPWPYNR
jgi:hypothetical protein